MSDEVKKKIEQICEYYKNEPIRDEIVRIVVEDMLKNNRSYDDIHFTLLAIEKHKCLIDNTEKIMNDGVSSNLVQKIMPYLTRNETSNVEIRKECFGKEFDFINCFTQKAYKTTRIMLEQLHSMIPSNDKIRFIQLYSTLYGSLDLFTLYANIYDKTGAIKENVNVFKAELEEINRQFFAKYQT